MPGRQSDKTLWMAAGELSDYELIDCSDAGTTPQTMLVNPYAAGGWFLQYKIMQKS